MRANSQWLALGLLALLAAGCGGGGGGGTPDPGPGEEPSLLAADTRGLAAGLNPDDSLPSPPEGAVDFGAAADGARADVVRAIEEADLYRVSGDLLYLLSAYRGLSIVDLSGLELLGQLGLQGVPLEMYLRGDRAFVLLADPQGGTELVEVSVATPAQPSVARRETLAGYYRTSRLIGDVLYTVTGGSVHSFLVGPTPFVPGSAVELGREAGFAHAGGDFIFVASGSDGGGTTVTVVEAADPGGALALRGAIDLPGYVGDDQKLSWGGGVLRVVTHDFIDRGLSRLFTIDLADPDAPAILATLELARGEQLFATRFTEDRAYLVTFERIDPLWVIDLADPAQPRIAGELEVPGFSTQMVVDGTQLVTIGMDISLGWQTQVSLFDVADPAQPTLVDREAVGDGSLALWERKAFSVHPDVVLVPRWDGVAVVERASASLTMRGVIPVAGGALRGFPHDTTLVAAGAEEVVVADAATLDAIGSVTIAENVVDVGRLADGTLLRLLQAGSEARLNGVEVELWAEALYPHGQSAAIVGWDALGRAAYVVDFSEATPVVSARLDLSAGGAPMVGDTPVSAPAQDLASGGAALIAPIYSGPQVVLTTSGKLVLRGLPAGDPWVFGDGDAVSDGLVVIDIPAASLSKGVALHGSAITGVVADGAVLAFTMAESAGLDDFARPLLEHDYVRIDLDAATATEPLAVPGYVVAASGPDLYTVQDVWGEDWSVTSTVVASRIEEDALETLDRLDLPERAYDLRAAGATLFFSTGGNLVPLFDGLADMMPWVPEADIGTVRLGAALTFGPRIDDDDAFRTLLLPEDGAALVTRDGIVVERWDFGGSEAQLDWSVELPGWPLRAHADPAQAGKYLVALGFAGDRVVP